MFRPNELPVEIAGGAYRLVRAIGQGGMAAVYAAEVDLARFDYPTAIAEREAPAALASAARTAWVRARAKELAGKTPAALSTLAVGIPLPEDGKAAVKVLMQHRTERFERRFEVEWRQLMAFNNRFLIRVYGGGFDEPTGVHYYAMELLEHQLTLKAMCQLDLAARLDLVRQAGRGLSVLHRAGVVHRDVKPQNLICRRFGTEIDVKLGDLGIAKAEGSSLTQTGESFGSVCYMPPEQLDDASRVGPEADVYALGSTLYHLLGGSPPYAGLGQREQMKLLAEGTPPSPIDELGDFPKAIGTLVRRMMSPDPARRPSLDSVLACLDDPAAPLAPESARPKRPDTREVRKSRSGMPAAPAPDVGTGTNRVRKPSGARGTREHAPAKRVPSPAWILIGAALVILVVVAGLLAQGGGSPRPGVVDPAARVPEAPGSPAAPTPSAPSEVELSERFKVALAADRDDAAYAALEGLRAGHSGGSALRTAENAWSRGRLAKVPTIDEDDRASAVARAERLVALGRRDAALQLFHALRALDEGVREDARDWGRYAAVLLMIGKLSRQLTLADAEDWYALAELARDRAQARIAGLDRPGTGSGSETIPRVPIADPPPQGSGSEATPAVITIPGEKIVEVTALYRAGTEALFRKDDATALRKLREARDILQAYRLNVPYMKSILGCTMVMVAQLDPRLSKDERDQEYVRAGRLIEEIPPEERSGSMCGAVALYRAQVGPRGAVSLKWFLESVTEFEREAELGSMWSRYADALEGVASSLRALGRADEATAWSEAATAAAQRHVRRPGTLVVGLSPRPVATPTNTSDLDAMCAKVESTLPAAGSPAGVWLAHAWRALAAAQAHVAGGKHQVALDLFHRARSSFDEVADDQRDWSTYAVVLDGIADELVALGRSAKTADDWRKRAKAARDRAKRR